MSPSNSHSSASTILLLPLPFEPWMTTISASRGIVFGSLNCWVDTCQWFLTPNRFKDSPAHYLHSRRRADWWVRGEYSPYLSVTLRHLWNIDIAPWLSDANLHNFHQRYHHQSHYCIYFRPCRTSTVEPLKLTTVDLWYLVHGLPRWTCCIWSMNYCGFPRLTCCS